MDSLLHVKVPLPRRKHGANRPGCSQVPRARILRHRQADGRCGLRLGFKSNVGAVALWLAGLRVSTWALCRALLAPTPREAYVKIAGV